MNYLNSDNIPDSRILRQLFRQMSGAFRDSEGGSLIERCEEISKLLFCKVFSEKQLSNTRENIPNPFTIENNENDENIYKRYLELYQHVVSTYKNTFQNGFQDISRDRLAVVQAVTLLRKINLSEVSTDIKGMAYEELLKNTFDKSENQQYFTPRTIVDFIIELVHPRVDMRICDPACGTGGFLVSVLQMLKKSYPHEQPQITGIEIDRRISWIAQLNILMHGGQEGSVFYLPEGGSLSFNKLNSKVFPDAYFDLIITNPPFGSEVTDSTILNHYHTGKSRSSRRRGVLFIERCLRALKPFGKLGIVIEDSVLNSTNDSDIRNFILRNSRVEAVVSLPDAAFMPYSSVKASILLLQKKGSPSKETHERDIFMATVNHIGRRPNGDPEYSSQRDSNGHLSLMNDLPDIAREWCEYESGISKCKKNENCFIAPRQQIEKGLLDESQNRLDTLFHHPIRYEADTILNRSRFPVIKLSKLVNVRNVQIIPSVSMPDESIRYIGLANITSWLGEYYFSDTMGYRLKSSVKLVKPGDILFSKLRPELRKCCIISQDEDEGYCSSECIVLTPINQKTRQIQMIHDNDVELYALPDFLAFVLRSDLILGQLIYQITGVGRPRISKKSIMDLRIPLPPIEVQQDLVTAFKSELDIYINTSENNERILENAKDNLRKSYNRAIEVLCPI